MSSTQKSLFLIGAGFIGGTVLTDLLANRKDLAITVLNRSDDKAEQLKKLGVTPLKGSLSDKDIIKEAASKSDIIIHTATADDLPSAAAVIEGIKSRKDGKKVIYLHTSGTGELQDKALGAYAEDPAKYAYVDTDPKSMDERLAPSAPHREIDLHILKELANPSSEKEHNARVAIIMPPLIYGLGTGPFNNISIQVPGLVSGAVKKGTGLTVGEGLNLWNAVHVQDLADGYLRVLSELEAQEPGAPGGPYWFAESELFEWRALVQRISSVLHGLGKTDGKVQVASDEDLEEYLLGEELSKETYPGNSICRADKLRSLGWKPREGRLSLFDSVEKEEIPEILKQKH